MKNFYSCRFGQILVLNTLFGGTGHMYVLYILYIQVSQAQFNELKATDNQAILGDLLKKIETQYGTSNYFFFLK